MRHKHADLIHAWAEGAEIEIYDPCVDQWKPSLHPSFSFNCDYRIKPTPKPDVVNLYYKVGETFSECLGVEGERCTHKHVLFCTFSGEDGRLIKAEVI
jgi:hypothetical protein